METSFSIPEKIIRNWQGIVDILAEITGIPAALIMRVNDPDIEVLLASDSAGNPYEEGVPGGGPESFLLPGMRPQTLPGIEFQKVSAITLSRTGKRKTAAGG